MNKKITNVLQKSLQSEVNDQLKYFGRVGGGLYDKLDNYGCYLDINNKVKKK